MGRTVKRLSNLEIDEVSLVDRPANQHGLVAIAKAHSQEDSMSVYDAEGREVFEDELQVGDFVYDDDGTEYQVTEGDEQGEESYEPEGELQEVGKATFGPLKRTDVLGRAGRAIRGSNLGSTAEEYANVSLKPRGKEAARRGRAAYDRNAAGVRGHFSSNAGRYALGGAGAGGLGIGLGAGEAHGRYSKSLGDQVLENLSKALTEDDRDEVISKAFDAMEEISKRNDQLEEAVNNLITEREADGYYEVAKGYGLGDQADLGGLLYRAAQVLPEDDVVMLDRLFTGAGEIQKAYFEEVGVAGGTESDVLGEIYAIAGEAVAKGAEAGLTQEQAVTALFAANPAAYDEYEAEQRGFGR